MKQRIALPAVPASVSAQERPFLQTMRDSLLQMMGTHRAIDRVVTFKDFPSSSIGKDNKIHVGTADPLQGQPPKPPREFMIERCSLANKLTWKLPTTGGVSHTEIWCADNSLFRSEAVRIGVVSSPVSAFVHSGLHSDHSYYYWIRTVSYGDVYSPWRPKDSQGGEVMPPLNPQTVNELLEIMTGDERYASVHTVKADSFQIIQPDKGIEEPVPVFIVGAVNGQPAVALRGNMIVDGSITARMLDADVVSGKVLSAASQITLGAGGMLRLQEGASLYAGAGNLYLSTEGDSAALLVAKDGGINEEGRPNEGHDYCALSEGDLQFWVWDGDKHELQRGVSKMVHGSYSPDNPNTYTVIDGRKAVPLEGVWRTPPAVYLSAQSFQTYNKDYANQSQRLRMISPELIETAPRHYAFCADVALVLSDATAFVTAKEGCEESRIAPFSSYTFSDSCVFPANTGTVRLGVSLPENTYRQETLYGWYAGTDNKKCIFDIVYYAVTAVLAATITWSDGSTTQHSVTASSATPVFIEAVQAGKFVTTVATTVTVSQCYSYSRRIVRYQDTSPTVGSSIMIVAVRAKLLDFAYRGDGAETPISQGTINWIAVGK